MQKLDFKNPEFLFCEIPIKNGTFNDNRVWIYHLPSLSLIEFVEANAFIDFKFNSKQALFQYEYENYIGVFTQNNCNNLNLNPDDILKKSWLFLKDYLAWEDKNIDLEND